MEFFYTFFGGMLENACFLSIFKTPAFSLQLLSENKEHIERNIEHFSLGITLVWQEAGTDSPFGQLSAFLQKKLKIKGLRMKNHIFRRSFAAISHIFLRTFCPISHIFRRSFAEFNE